MKREQIFYSEYKEEIIRIYRGLRRERYYHNILINLFEDCIPSDMKVIPVYLNISIEVKKPDILFNNGKIVKYNYLKTEGKKLKQLQEEFRHCKYIIFTDCITWYFLRYDNKIYKSDICLIDNLQWKQDMIWKNLKDRIRKIINESKQMNV